MPRTEDGTPVPQDGAQEAGPPRDTARYARRPSPASARPPARPPSSPQIAPRAAPDTMQ